jgi:hypothetical protein
MRLATYKWNVKVTINGKTGVPEYYGYRTKAHAEAIAQRWREAGYQAEVIRY